MRRLAVLALLPLGGCAALKAAGDAVEEVVEEVVEAVGTETETPLIEPLVACMDEAIILLLALLAAELIRD